MSTTATPAQQTQVITVSHPMNVNKWEVILAAIQAVMSTVNPVIIHILPQQDQALATKIDNAIETSLAVTVATMGAISANSTNTVTPPVQ